MASLQMTPSSAARDNDVRRTRVVETVEQHVLEVVCDAGAGAQTAGRIFGNVSAKMGNGVWMVELVPDEIEPAPRSRSSASGMRIRIGSSPVTNAGDAADVVVSYDEQVLYGRIESGALRRGTLLLIDDKWAADLRAPVREAYADAIADFTHRGYVVREVPIEKESARIVADAQRGKNLWTLGLLCALYERDLSFVRAEIAAKLEHRGEEAVRVDCALVEAGHAWGQENLDRRFGVPSAPSSEKLVMMSGNRAVALGILASGMELCTLYPITPATSVANHLAAAFDKTGGFIHQAEDEIAAIGFALGASYAGKTAVMLTSSPGLALATEFIGLAVMGEIPIVIVDVQRGGPATGLPTRVEQGDLLAALYGAPGDAPKIILAPSTISECFHFMIAARKLAETFRGPVIVLTDASFATAEQPFPRPSVQEQWLAPPFDQSDWDGAVPAYAWDSATGASNRPIPGQRGGQYVLTGLTHDERSRIAHDPAVNQRSIEMRSRKLALLERSLKRPEIHGDPEGDLLVVCWGSTRGAVEEAVDRARADGGKVSSLALRFLSPLEPGLAEIFRRFRSVMTVEINYGDDPASPNVTPENRRYAQLAWLLRARTLVDLDFFARVSAAPLSPGLIEAELRRRLKLA